MVGNRRWSEKEIAHLREHFRNINTHRLPEAYEGRSYDSIRTKALRMGLKKSHDRMREMGVENRKFGRQKGEPPKSQPPPPQAA